MSGVGAGVQVCRWCARRSDEALFAKTSSACVTSSNAYWLSASAPQAAVHHFMHPRCLITLLRGLLAPLLSSRALESHCSLPGFLGRTALFQGFLAALLSSRVFWPHRSLPGFSLAAPLSSRVFLAAPRRTALFQR